MHYFLLFQLVELSFDGDEKNVLEIIQNWFIQVHSSLSFSLFFVHALLRANVRVYWRFHFSLICLYDTSGFAGGSYYSHTGAAAEFVCLPPNPDLTTKYTSSYARIYGAEYDTSDFAPRAEDGNDLPCSVCRSTVGSSVLMIPGKSSCYDGWTLQYHGDLVAGDYTHAAATQYICLDEHYETLTAGQDNHEGKLIYPVKAMCGSLACPPYHNDRYLTCVVCTK